MAPQRNRSLILGLLLVVATLAFYNPVVRNPFLDYDDLSYIQKNNHVLGGLTWEDIKWSLTTTRDGNWHPLTWMSHALDCQLFGLNPAGHHYVNLLFHAASAVLLFLLLQQATGFTWASLCVAALFALHPVNVESVAWAAERKNVLSMFFFLLTLIAYDGYARGSGRKRYERQQYGLALLFFALGLMAKSQIVTLPFVLLLWDFWPLERMAPAPTVPAKDSPEIGPPRSFSYLVIEKWPFFVLAAADSVITVWAQRAGASVRTLAEAPMSIRLENALVSYVRYLGEAVWPTRLAPIYPRPSTPPLPWQLAGAAVILLLISALVWHWRERRYLLFGWCWFLGTLVPMIGIITVGEQSMADRYAYIPLIGLFIAVVWAASAAVSEHRISPAWPAAVAVAIILVLGCLTYRQVGRWRDPEALWRYTLSVTEANYVAHNNLAIVLAKQGRADEAVAEYRESNALHRFQPSQLLELGYYEMLLGHPEQAIKDANDVLQDSMSQGVADARLQASAWGQLGEAQMALGNYGLAADSYKKAFQRNPQDKAALVGAGLLAMRQGRSDLAVQLLLQAVRVEPSDANVLLYAEALRRAGRASEADSAVAQVQKIAPDVREARFEAGQLLSLAGLKPL
jgi:tetratricopeptide (TPR) repeat protein